MSVVSSPSCTIRLAKPADAAALAALRNELAEHFLSAVPATEEKTMELMDGSHTYVLEVDGTLVGSFALRPSPTVGLEFAGFMVASAWQRCGYGRMLLQHAITRARSVSVGRRLFLTAKPGSVAYGLYKEVGFDVKSVRMEMEL